MTDLTLLANTAAISDKNTEIDYALETRRIVNVTEKKWNTHMLRVCTKYLTELPRKEFKIKRRSATDAKDIKKELQIMENMLAEKASTLNAESFEKFYKKLCEFESKKIFHPRKKIIDY